jgi:uncharacterized phage-associated protein
MSELRTTLYFHTTIRKSLEGGMASAHDVAAYILSKCGDMTAMKLQKLAYYSHAWHLVWEERPLFSEPIEAWANGPVVRDLYNHHRGQFTVSQWSTGDRNRLDEHERSSVDAVLRFYGDKSAHELSELTHREEPWRRARAGAPEGARSWNPISDADMFEYYDGLTSAAL